MEKSSEKYQEIKAIVIQTYLDDDKLFDQEDCEIVKDWRGEKDVYWAQIWTKIEKDID